MGSSHRVKVMGEGQGHWVMVTWVKMTWVTVTCVTVMMTWVMMTWVMVTWVMVTWVMGGGEALSSIHWPLSSLVPVCWHEFVKSCSGTLKFLAQ